MVATYTLDDLAAVVEELRQAVHRSGGESVGHPKLHGKDAHVTTAGYLGDHGALAGLLDDDHTQYVLRSLLTTRGDLPYRGASDWARLADVALGQVLISGGVGADPAWSASPLVTALILGAATTAGGKVFIQSGALLIREGDNSDYIPVFAQSLTLSGYSDLAEIAAPSTPAAGFGRVYAGADNKLHYKSDDGLDTALSGLFGISYVMDGGGSALTTGIKGNVHIPVTGNIAGWQCEVDAGTITVDVNIAAYNTTPSYATATGGAGGRPNVSSGLNLRQMSEPPTSWGITTVALNDSMQFEIDAVATATRCTVTVFIRRT